MTNRPINFNDPTGHMLDNGCATEGCNLTPLQKAIDAQKQKKHEAEAARRKCAKGNKNYCSAVDNIVNTLKNDVIPLVSLPTFETDTSAVSGQTYYDYASQGNLSYMLKLLTPTHAGFRLQGEFTGSIGPWSPAITFGVNWAHNFISGEHDSNVDLTVELYSAGMGTPVGGSVTGGSLIGWGSSNVKDVTSGKSEVFGGTVAAGTAISASVVAPTNNAADKLLVDPIYGIVPTTIYVGGGAGCCYVGGGIGKSMIIIP